jgi:hypothetical protein
MSRCDAGYIISHPLIRRQLRIILGIATSVVSHKFIEEQLQILRLTTPNLHPTNEDLFVGTPERLKSTPGAPFAQDDSSFRAAYFRLMTLARIIREA